MSVNFLQHVWFHVHGATLGVVHLSVRLHVSPKTLSVQHGRGSVQMIILRPLPAAIPSVLLLLLSQLHSSPQRRSSPPRPCGTVCSDDLCTHDGSRPWRRRWRQQRRRQQYLLEYPGGCMVSPL